MKSTVLYVDDEQDMLVNFKELYEEDFNIITADSPEKALKIFKENLDIGVVLSDMRMPGPNSERAGVDLLMAIKKQRPTVVRILTTAFADMDSAIDAVNQGNIYKYILKPWTDHDDLKVTLRNALEFYNLKKQRDILVVEKLNVKHRSLLADRVRNLAMVAASLNNTFNNSLSALQAYLSLCPLRANADESETAQGNLEDMWNQNLSENLKIIQGIQKMTTDFEKYADNKFNILIEDFITSPIAAAEAEAVGFLNLSFKVDIEADLPGPRNINNVMMEKFFHILIMRMIKLDVSNNAPEGVVYIKAFKYEHPEKGSGVKVSISRLSKKWNSESINDFFSMFFIENGKFIERGLDLLVAFFILYHHQGEITTLKDPIEGPCFEAFIPFNQKPADNNDELVIEDVMATLFDKYEEADMAMMG